MLERIKNEPVLVTAFVQAVLGLLLSFGLGLTPEQVGSIMVLTGAGLAFFARSKVMPTRNT